MRRRLTVDREPLLRTERGLFVSPGFFGECTPGIRAYVMNRDSRLEREDARWWSGTARYPGAPVTWDRVRTAGCKGFW
jgi:hypothetical protein